MTSRTPVGHLVRLAVLSAFFQAGCASAPSVASTDPMLAHAEFEVLSPAGQEPVPFRFDVESFSRTLANEFSETPLPGGSPVVQFTYPHGERISLTLHYDTSDSGLDAHAAMEPVLDLMEVSPELHAPPVLRFRWESFEFPCILEEAAVSIQELDAEGRAIRAQLSVSLREYRSLEQQLGEQD